jgi:hypothetical protein
MRLVLYLVLVVLVLLHQYQALALHTQEVVVVELTEELLVLVVLEAVAQVRLVLLEFLQLLARPT